MKERSGYYWDVLAWRNSRRVKAMDPIARAIYREVMDEIWINGPVPDDIQEISIATGWSIEHVTKSWPTIHDCLQPTKKNPDLFTSERLEEERRKRNLVKRKRKEAAEKRWNKDANALQMQSKSNASAMQDYAIQEQVLEQVQVPSSNDKKESPSEIPKKKGLHEIPGDFVVPNELWEWAMHPDQGFTYAEVRLQTDKFLDYFRSTGKKKKDWIATWRNWLRNSRERQHVGKSITALQNFESKGQRLIRQQREESARFDQILHGPTSDEFWPSDPSGTDCNVRKSIAGSE